MAEAEQKLVSRIKIKKKLWYKLVAPKLFGQKELGETYLESPEAGLGRLMKINLKDLTGNVKDQNAYINFKLDRVDGSLLRTSTIGYELTPTYVKKMIRKNTDRLDDYFVLKTKGKHDVIVKSVIITQYKAQRSVKGQLKRELKLLLENEIKGCDFSTFIGNLVNRKIYFNLRKALNRIYPIKEIAVRFVKLRSGKAEDTVEIKEEPQVKEELKEKVKEEPKKQEVPAEKKEQEVKIAEEVKEEQ